MGQLSFVIFDSCHGIICSSVTKSHNGDKSHDFAGVGSEAWLIHLQISLDVFHLFCMWHRLGIEAWVSCSLIYLTRAVALSAPV